MCDGRAGRPSVCRAPRENRRSRPKGRVPRPCRKPCLRRPQHRPAPLSAELPAAGRASPQQRGRDCLGPTCQLGRRSGVLRSARRAGARGPTVMRRPSCRTSPSRAAGKRNAASPRRPGSSSSLLPNVRGSAAAARARHSISGRSSYRRETALSAPRSDRPEEGALPTTAERRRASSSGGDQTTRRTLPPRLPTVGPARCYLVDELLYVWTAGILATLR